MSSVATGTFFLLFSMFWMSLARRSASGTPRRLMPTSARFSTPVFSVISWARRTSVRSISEADINCAFSWTSGCRGTGSELMDLRLRVRGNANHTRLTRDGQVTRPIPAWWRAKWLISGGLPLAPDGSADGAADDAEDDERYQHDDGDNGHHDGDALRSAQLLDGALRVGVRIFGRRLVHLLHELLLERS